MMTLYTFGPMFGLPDPSPFCMKAEVLLKMAGVSYTLNHAGFMQAPKGKQPYLDDNGVTIADTTFIRWHLEQKHGADFDKGLSSEQKAAAWAFEKLCEDNLYWGVVRDRWMIPANFDNGPRAFFNPVPALLRPLIVAKALREVKRNLHGQGLGRHSIADCEKITIAGVKAIADFLGSKPFLMGDTPCGADATVFSFVSGMMCPLFTGPIHDAAAGHANLVAYRDRGMAKWYPDFKAA
jgi:glutathione S-transferase